MPIQIDIDRAIFKWQAHHNERMTYSELARRAGITIQALNRLKSGETIAPDLRKINEICKVLECEPGDLLVRKETGHTDEAVVISEETEAERQKVLSEIQKTVDRKLQGQSSNKRRSGS